MKRNFGLMYPSHRHPWLHVIWSMAILMCLFAGPSQADTNGAVAVSGALKLVANYWEPYTGEHLRDGGLATRIVQTALQRSGYQSDISVVPWPRAMLMMKGPADGIVAIWYTEERNSTILFSDSYLTNNLLLFHMPDLAVIPRQLADLRGVTVGVGRDYDYSEDFLRAKHFQKQPASATLTNLLKLTRKRVDLVLEDERIVDYQIALNQENHPELLQIKAAPSALMRVPLYFGISRKRPDAAKIIEHFNTALASMRRDGTLAKMIADSLPLGAR